ncbi:MAG: hypothetical protein ACTHJ3_04760 [Pararhizobium sp.]
MDKLRLVCWAQLSLSFSLDARRAAAANHAAPLWKRDGSHAEVSMLFAWKLVSRSWAALPLFIFEHVFSGSRWTFKQPANGGPPEVRRAVRSEAIEDRDSVRTKTKLPLIADAMSTGNKNDQV